MGRRKLRKACQNSLFLDRELKPCSLKQ